MSEKISPLTWAYKVTGIFDNELAELSSQMVGKLPRDKSELKEIISAINKYQDGLQGRVASFELVREAAESLLVDLEEEDVEY